MPEPTRYLVAFDSTDDGDLDAETIALEDSRMTLDEIKATCSRYRVRAQYREHVGGEIKTYVPPNERRVPFGEK